MKPSLLVSLEASGHLVSTSSGDPCRYVRGVVDTLSGVLFVATTPSSTSKADWSALLERPVVSELCSAAMLLPCAATCPSVVARASALLSSFEASSAVSRSSRDWMAVPVFTARSATWA